MKGEPAWRELAVTVEAAVQSAYPSVTGLYVIAPTRGDTRRAKDRDVDALARTVAEHFDAGAATEAAVDDVWLRYFHGQPELVVESAYGMSGFEDGSESEARFRKALASNIGKMRKAGEAGYETHLAVIHGTIGTTHGWR